MAKMSADQFEMLLRGCWPRVRGIVRRFAQGPDAEDLGQEVAIRAWEHRGQLRDYRLFEAWMVRIALNVSRAALRRRGRVHFCSLHAVEESPGGDPAPEVADAESLARALATLTEAERTTLTLRAEQLSGREIARHLDEREGTTRARLSRSRRKLAAALRCQGWTSLGRYFEDKE